MAKLTMYANITKETRKAIYKRDFYCCALCDCPTDIQVHHVIPRAQGGTDSMHNLITLCRYCHSLAPGRPLNDTDITAEDIEQACVEYLADYYAPNFNPWARE